MRTIFLLFLASGAIFAQSWDTLRALRPGDPVKVQETTGTTHKGSFAGFSPDAITVTVKGTQTPVERARVRRVEVRSVSRRVRRTLIGAAIGAGVGVGIDQSIGAIRRNESGQSTGERAVTYLGPIGAFGGIFAAFPAYRTVYKAQ